MSAGSMKDDPEVKKMIEDERRLKWALSIIRDERHQQDAQWGGPKHDDAHEPADWVMFLSEHVGKLAGLLARSNTHNYDRKCAAAKVAALACALIERIDREEGNER